MNLKKIFEISEFWAVQYAKEAIQRAQKKGKNFVTLRCANTPTGVLHIGNANDIIRNYFIAKCIEILGFKAKVIFTSDDRDPIRGFPPVICDKNGNLVEFKEREEYEKKYDGYPVCLIPDPFKCHSSWSEHFLSVYFNELRKLGILEEIDFEYYSPNVLYHTGEWEEYVKKVLENKEKIKEIYKEFKEHIREYPFSVICEKCGRIGTTHVINYNPETGEVEYVCEKRHLKKKTVEGCGYKGRTTIRRGKVDWYIEWAINWVYFDTDLEPMGKDHWVSSWKISTKIVKEIFNFEPPIPVPYDYFTVFGQKMSGSKGNIINLTELLKLLEPEIVLYLYSKRPMQERDIGEILKNLHQLVDEWDKLEEKVWKTKELLEKGEIKEEDLADPKKVKELNIANAEEFAIYYLCMKGFPERKPVRVPYSFCAIIGQLLKDERKIRDVLLRTKHIPEDIDEKEWKRVLERIERAKYWIEKYGPEIYKIKIEQGEVKLDDKDKETIKRIIEFLERNENWTIDYVQTEIHKIICETNDPKSFYKKLYKMFLNKEAGPKIGTLICVLGKDRSIEILQKYL